MIVLEFTCIALALALVYLSFKVCNTKRSIYLLGLPFGFFFLMISYIFLGLHLVDLTTYPFRRYKAFQLTHVVKSSYPDNRNRLNHIPLPIRQSIPAHSKNSYLLILAGSTILILTTFGALYYFNPSNITSVYHDTHLFSLLNIILLSFIICLLLGKFS